MPDDEGPPAAEHYFTERPHSRPRRIDLRFLYRGEMLSFQVDAGVFAGRGLDRGTELLIENMVVGPSDRVLDLGCGWGAIGTAAAKSARSGSALLTDVNKRAAGLARRNLERNGISNAEVRVGPLYRPVGEERFDVIATNPPYHAGRPLILELLEESPEHLRPGGRLYLVGKGSQGIRYYQSWLEANWPGSVEVVGRGSGYRVLEARSGLAAAPALPSSSNASRDEGEEPTPPTGAAKPRGRPRPSLAPRSA